MRTDTYMFPHCGKEFKVKPVTGVEEELFADMKYKNNGGKLITAVLMSTVVEIAGEKPTEQMIKALVIGDRDYAMISLRKTSFGDEAEYKVRCPKCNKVLTVDYMFDSIEVVHNQEDGFPFELVDGIEGKEAIVQKAGYFKFPDGNVQEKVGAIVDANASKGLTALLAHCIEKIGDTVVTAENIRRMTKRDRDLILNIFMEKAPGPRLSLDVTCGACGVEFSSMIGADDFFYPSS